MEYAGPMLAVDIVLPWCEREVKERAWLAAFGGRTGDPIPAATNEDLCRLYALSRVRDLLLTVDVGASEVLMQTMGLRRRAVPAFSPFFHEVVRVDQSDRVDEPITVVRTLWDGWCLGALQFARAGVHVRGGADHIVKEVAEQSTMYWTFRRSDRPTSDPSRGWGSNSSWRTPFRRDYAIDGKRWYNVDAKARRPRDEDEDLSPDEMAEIVRHRCFIRSRRPDGDLFPYDDAWVETVEGG